MKNFPFNERIVLKNDLESDNVIEFGWSKSPFGQSLIFIKSDIVVGLAFQNNQNKDNIEMQMMYHWDTKITQFMRLNTDNIAEHIFFSNCKINLSFTGHGLQNSVWKELLNTPKGNKITYSDLAKNCGYPKAVRAVASAIGKNPISWLIPCHRVIRKSGALGGYRWGLDLKKHMLEKEALI